MKQYQRLIFNKKIKPGEIIIRVVKYSNRINSKPDLSIHVKSCVKVSEDRITVRFTWRSVTMEENREIQAHIANFISNGFRGNINNLLCDVSDWPAAKIVRTCRRTKNAYCCEIISA